MRGRGICFLGVAVVTGLVVANGSHPRASAADWARPHSLTTSTGITATYPRAWEAFADRGSVVISSFRIPRDWPSWQHKHVPGGGIYIWVFTYGRAWKGYPRGSNRFELRRQDRGFYGCGFGLEGYRILFTANSRAMQAMVALGDGAREGDALAVLDRISVAPA